jgi:hypothetical protein
MFNTLHRVSKSLNESEGTTRVDINSQWTELVSTPVLIESHIRFIKAIREHAVSRIKYKSMPSISCIPGEQRLRELIENDSIASENINVILDSISIRAMAADSK